MNAHSMQFPSFLIPIQRGVCYDRILAIIAYVRSENVKYCHSEIQWTYASIVHHSHKSDFMKKILRQSVRRYLKVKSDIRKEDSEIE
jgi:hypothetical protein